MNDQSTRRHHDMNIIKQQEVLQGVKTGYMLQQQIISNCEVGLLGVLVEMCIFKLIKTKKRAVVLDKSYRWCKIVIFKYATLFDF